jgi:hypothetical protein
MASTWTVVEPSLPALTHTYSFGPGIASSLALVVEGGVVLVSPPCNVADAVFTDLAEHGPLRALVAPNAFHSMGLAPWRERNPDVPIFAPAQSIARLEKTTKITSIKPVAEASGLIGDRVEVVDMPHYKTGEILVRWRGEGGWVWYLTDVAMNLPVVPKGPFGWIMKWTKSGPGLRRNAIASMFMIKDKRALYGWIAEQADKTPPSLIVPCHGDLVRPSDPAGEIRAAFA